MTLAAAMIGAPLKMVIYQFSDGGGQEEPGTSECTNHFRLLQMVLHSSYHSVTSTDAKDNPERSVKQLEISQKRLEQDTDKAAWQKQLRKVSGGSQG